MPTDSLKRTFNSIFSEQTEQSRLDEILEKVAKYEVERPFTTLTSMPAERRNNIRKTLNFKWDSETIQSSNINRAKFEAWEIIDCDMKGIIARIHSIKEQLFPTNYNSWRRTLTRILDISGIHYDASATEVELEKLILSILDKYSKLNKKSDSNIPTDAFKKMGKGVGLAASVVKDIGTIWDDLFGSEDEPAINAIFAICAFNHKGNENKE